MFGYVHNYSTGTACICFSTNIPAFATVPLGQTHHVSLTLPLAAPVLKPLFSFLVSQFSMAKHKVFGSCIFTQNTFCFTIRPSFYFSFTDLSRKKCNPVAIWVLLPSLMALAKKEAQAATSPMWGSYSLIPGLSIWPAEIYGIPVSLQSVLPFREPEAWLKILFPTWGRIQLHLSVNLSARKAL